MSSKLLRISLICAFRIFSSFRTAFDGRRRLGYIIWRLFKFPASNVVRKREKMQNAHISEMRSNQCILIR
jgi:hypothetical protein